MILSPRCRVINKKTKYESCSNITGANPGFQVRRGTHLKKIGAGGGRRENCWGISCEKSRFYAKKIIFFPILGGGGAGWWPTLPPPLFFCFFLQFFSHTLLNIILVSNDHKSTISFSLFWFLYPFVLFYYQAIFTISL
jgi:hypothetical protein